ncbi:MAG: Fe-S cluster assembly sulfur transfer protein SufU [Schwartzia sp. (in: firmicutes)]
MGLEEIYTELIAEESRNPAHRRHLAHPTAVLKGRNPSCGDEITLEVEVKNGVIESAAFTGVGCAISQASTSLMIDLIEGQSVEKAKHLIALFLGMIKGDIADDDALEDLGDAAALKSIATLPARVKCAVLSWHTLDEVLGEGK